MSTPSLIFRGLQELSNLPKLPPSGGKQALPGSFFFPTPSGVPVPFFTASVPALARCSLCSAEARRYVRVSELGTFEAFRCTDSSCPFSRNVNARLDGQEHLRAEELGYADKWAALKAMDYAHEGHSHE